MSTLDENTALNLSDLKLPNMHEDLQRLLRELTPEAKKATLLFCEKSDGQNSPIATQIGGTDFYFQSNKKWPVSDANEKELTPVIQINLDDLAEFELKEKKGVFQIFIDADKTFESISLTKDTPGIEIRYIKDVAEEKAKKISPSKDTYIAGPFTLKKQSFLSLPSARSKYCLPKEHLFMNWNWDKKMDNGGRLWSEYNYTEGLYIEDALISRIGGYAPWLTHDQTPVCPVCGGKMRFLAAVGTEDTGLDFGGDGYLMLFSCNNSNKCQGLSNPSLIIQCY